MLTIRQEERLLDVNADEALPRHTYEKTRARVARGEQRLPQPTARVSLHADAGTTDVALLAHLYLLRTRAELFDETTVELGIDAWERIAREHGRLLYDCHACKVTWPIREDADTCPALHEIGE